MNCKSLQKASLATPEFHDPQKIAQASYLDIKEGLAHIYTECSRIWNSIHIGRAESHRGGLAKPLLHRTATLALIVAHMVKNILLSDPTKIRRIGCRFSRPIMAPTHLRIETVESGKKLILF